MGKDTFHQTSLLRALSNPALNTAREGAATDNLCQGLTTLKVKNFFLIPHLILPSFTLKPLPLVLSLYALGFARRTVCEISHKKHLSFSHCSPLSALI